MHGQQQQIPDTGRTRSHPRGARNHEQCVTRQKEKKEEKKKENENTTPKPIPKMDKVLFHVYETIKMLAITKSRLHSEKKKKKKETIELKIVDRDRLVTIVIWPRDIRSPIGWFVSVITRIVFR